MIDHVYRGRLHNVRDSNCVEISVDLGFKVRQIIPFHFYGVVIKSNHTFAETYVRECLELSDDILVKSYKEDVLYYGDFTYKMGQQWYNLNQSLIRNKIGILDARE